MTSRGFSVLRNAIILVIFGAFVGAGFYIVSRNENESGENKIPVIKDEISNFDECVAGGGAIKESIPEKCTIDGKTYTP
jgi:hypothetical protein